MIKDVDVLTCCKALQVDRKERRGKVHFIEEYRQDNLAYDTLVLATGSRPSRGMD